MKKRILLSLAVGVLFFVVFLLGQASIRNFRGWDDPYYHARHSALMNETGNLTLTEPWLVMHFLSYAPTDPWWGYHAVMAGFIHFFGTVWGSKILSALLAALTFAIFYFILAAHKTPQPFFWTVLFWGLSGPLLNRLLLERPHLLTLPVLMLAWFFASRKKYVLLAALSAVYALAYQLAPLVLVVVAACLLADYLLERRFDLKLIIASAGGLLGGILLHPQSLNYIYVMYEEIWRALYLRFIGIDLHLGDEMITLPFSWFLRSFILPLIFYLSALALLAAFRRDWTKQTLRDIYSLANISGAWFIVSLVVPRGAVEYWLPFAWLFAALSWSAILLTVNGEKIKNYFSRFITKTTRPFVYALFAGFMAFNVTNLVLVIQEQNTEQFTEQAKEAAEWLKINTGAGSVVFYDNWSFWPPLFYYNQHNRYLSGMDPTFTYDYNPELFWLWRNISFYGWACDQSDACPRASARLAMEGMADAIRNQFQSEYVFTMNSADSWFYKILNTKKQDFARVFSNSRFSVYKVLPPSPSP